MGRIGLEAVVGDDDHVGHFAVRGDETPQAAIDEREVSVHHRTELGDVLGRGSPPAQLETMNYASPSAGYVKSKRITPVSMPALESSSHTGGEWRARRRGCRRWMTPQSASVNSSRKNGSSSRSTSVGATRSGRPGASTIMSPKTPFSSGECAVRMAAQAGTDQ